MCSIFSIYIYKLLCIFLIPKNKLYLLIYVNYPFAYNDLSFFSPFYTEENQVNKIRKLLKKTDIKIFILYIFILNVNENSMLI